MNRLCVSILAIPWPIALLAVACAETLLPTATPGHTETQEPFAKPVLEPSAWLLGYGEAGLTIYDSITGDRADPDLPPLWFPESDLREIPSSGLLAARVASTRGDPSDIALAILRLPQGEVLRRIPLFSDELVGWMEQGGGDGRLDTAMEDTRLAIAGLSFRPRWSPDGLSVAFAAALEGAIADVYTYDVLRDELRQLTDGSDQAVVLGWSPDGEWVLYTEAFGFWSGESDYIPVSVGAVSNRTRELRGPFELLAGLRPTALGWLSASEVVLVGVDPYDAARSGLYQANLITGRATPLYDGPFHGVSLDPKSGTLALSLEDDPTLGSGVAIMTPGDGPSLVQDPWVGEAWGEVHWYPQLGRFFAGSDAGALAFTPDGRPAEAFEDEGCTPSASPDGRWLAFGPCTGALRHRPGLRIYSAAGRLFRELEATRVDAAVWGSGSEGLYYLSSGPQGLTLMWADLSSGSLRVIDRDPRRSLVLIQPEAAAHELVRALPTAAPIATRAATPVPSATPQRALDPAGPWLVGMARQGPVAINPDGSGRTALFTGLPESGQQRWLDFEMSSTGWVAALTLGSPDSPRSLVVGRPGGGAGRRIPIMPPELAAAMEQPDDTGGTRGGWTRDVRLAFHEWMDTLSWSPDGRTLAYVAAVDGPSADVFVYDTVNDQVRRLTRGPNQPRLLGWSADGRWILHLEIKDINVGDGIWWDTLGLWAAAADGSEVRKVPGVENRLSLLHWGSPGQFLVVHYENGPLPPFRIELIDLLAGPVATLYPGYLYEWAVDPVTGTIAFLVDPNVNLGVEGLEAGLYVASPSRPTPQLVGYENPAKQPYLGYTSAPVWSPELNAFLVTTREDRVAVISTAGEVVRRIQGVCHLPVPSPDRRWLAFEPCSKAPFGLQLRSEQGGRDIELRLGPFNDFFWSPDSAGLYYFQGEYPERLMYVPIPGGTPRLVHPDSGLESGRGRPRFVWGP